MNVQTLSIHHSFPYIIQVYAQKLNQKILTIINYCCYINKKVKIEQDGDIWNVNFWDPQSESESNDFSTNFGNMTCDLNSSLNRKQKAYVRMTNTIFFTKNNIVSNNPFANVNNDNYCLSQSRFVPELMMVKRKNGNEPLSIGIDMSRMVRNNLRLVCMVLQKPKSKKCYALCFGGYCESLHRNIISPDVIETLGKNNFTLIQDTRLQFLMSQFRISSINSSNSKMRIQLFNMYYQEKKFFKYFFDATLNCKLFINVKRKNKKSNNYSMVTYLQGYNMIK